MPDTLHPSKPGLPRVSIQMDFSLEVETSLREDWLKDRLNQALQATVSSIIGDCQGGSVQLRSMSVSIQPGNGLKPSARRGSKRSV